MVSLRLLAQSPSRLRRLFALVAIIVVITAACSSDDSTTGTAGGDDATEADSSDDGASNDGASDTATNLDEDGFPTSAPPDAVSGLASSLIATNVSDEQLNCLVEDADGDSQLTTLYIGIGTPSYQITPEGFTALTGSVHDCVDNTTLATSLLPLSGAPDAESAQGFTTCIGNQINEEGEGDLIYTGMAALAVGFPVPEGAQDVTIAAAQSCVGPEQVADQVSLTREQASGFADVVDRACVSEGLDDAAVTAFWEGLVRNTGPVAEFTELLEGCTESFDSGLPDTIPVDFEPWAGEGVLAGVDPAARNGAYDSAPPNLLEDGVDYQAVLTTTDGEILIDLFEDTAPITVNNFIALARDGYYDGTIFHRVLSGFMAQGGDPTGTGTGGPGFSFDDEQSALTPIDRRGLLAMANSGPNTNGSQFFITLNAATHLNGLHAVFGELVTGDDIFSQIELRDPAAPTSRGELLLSVEITES